MRIKKNNEIRTAKEEIMVGIKPPITKPEHL